MSTYSQPIAAGGAWEIGVPGELFRIISAISPLDITFKLNGVPKGKVSGVLDGFWSKPEGGFNSVLIESAAAQTPTIAIFTGDAGYDRTATQARNGTFAVTAASVGAASAQLLPANSGRNLLTIQNNGASDIYVNFGAVATVAGGVKIEAGGMWELDTFAPSNAVHAITAGGTNASIILMEA